MFYRAIPPPCVPPPRARLIPWRGAETAPTAFHILPSIATVSELAIHLFPNLPPRRFQACHSATAELVIEPFNRLAGHNIRCRQIFSSQTTSSRYTGTVDKRHDGGAAPISSFEKTLGKREAKGGAAEETGRFPDSSGFWAAGQHAADCREKPRRAIMAHRLMFLSVGP